MSIFRTCAAIRPALTQSLLLEWPGATRSQRVVRARIDNVPDGEGRSLDRMHGGRDRPGDSSQTTDATDATLIKGPNPRIASPSAAPHGRLPRTTERAWVVVAGLRRALSDRRIPSSTESRSFVTSSAR